VATPKPKTADELLALIVDRNRARQFRFTLHQDRGRTLIDCGGEQITIEAEHLRELELGGLIAVPSDVSPTWCVVTPKGIKHYRKLHGKYAVPARAAQSSRSRPAQGAVSARFQWRLHLTTARGTVPSLPFPHSWELARGLRRSFGGTIRASTITSLRSTVAPPGAHYTIEMAYLAEPAALLEAIAGMVAQSRLVLEGGQRVDVLLIRQGPTYTTTRCTIRPPASSPSA